MPLPGWLRDVVSLDEAATPEDSMRAAIAIALANARRGHGPFGAVIADAQGRVVEVGWNRVLESCDSTAHAEIEAIRRCEARLGTHQLLGRDLTLYSSCAPCIQCFGAIWWSGISRVLWAAGKEEAEAIGFEEGPVTPALWALARAERGIESVPGFGLDEAAREPFREYRARGGANYSRE